jgi:hypothetical protein
VTTLPRRVPRREMDASMRMPIHRGHHHRLGLSVLAQAARHPMTAVFSPANFASAPGALPRLPTPLRQWKYTVSLNHNHNLPDLSSHSPFLLSVFTLCLQSHDTDYTLLYNRIWCLCMNLPVLSHVFWFVPMQKTRQHIRSFDTLNLFEFCYIVSTEKALKRPIVRWGGKKGEVFQAGYLVTTANAWRFRGILLPNLSAAG